MKARHHPVARVIATRPLPRTVAKTRNWPTRRAAFTLVEAMVAVTVLVFSAVGVTEAMIQLNRQVAISRVSNAAKAEAPSRIQQVSQSAYAPAATLAVITAILATGGARRQWAAGRLHL